MHLFIRIGNYTLYLNIALERKTEEAELPFIIMYMYLHRYYYENHGLWFRSMETYEKPGRNQKLREEPSFTEVLISNNNFKSSHMNSFTYSAQVCKCVDPAWYTRVIVNQT